MIRPSAVRLAANGSSGAPTGSLVTAALPAYASTIDAGLTALTGRVAYHAGFQRRTVLFALHGLDGSAADFGNDQLERYTRAGFFVVMPSARGLGGSSGSDDLNGRSTHDPIDALASLRAHQTFGPTLHPTRVAVVGYSNGGALALAMLAKYPDFASLYVAHFPSTDYAEFWTDQPNFRATMQTKTGGTPAAVPNAYAARSSRLAVVQQLSALKGLPGPFVHVIHDEGDPVVPVHHSTDLGTALTAAGIGAERFAAHYSQVTQATKVRYVHGYAAPSHPGNVLAESFWLAAARNAEPFVHPRKGRARVHGHFRILSQGLGIWLGVSAGGNPKTTANAGHEQTAIVDYDLDAGTFYVSPITGALRCRIESGATSAEADVAANGTTLLEPS